MSMNKIALMIFSLCITPAIGYAHSAWVKASPDEGEILTKPPQQVSFKLIGFLNTELSNIEVLDQERNKVSKEAQFLRSGDFTTMKVELLDGLKSGEYTVKWTFVNLDQHKQPGQSGSYKFTIK